MGTTTPNLGLYKPTAEPAENGWGDLVNANWDVLDLTPNDTWLRARNSADTGNVNLLKVNTSDRVAFGTRFTSDGYLLDSNSHSAAPGAWNIVSAYGLRYGGGLIGDTTIAFTCNLTDSGTQRTAITAATNATPIVITATAHGLSNGDVVGVGEVQGNGGANGKWVVANKTTNTFELAGTTGTGAYTTGGFVTSSGAMYGASFVVSPTTARVLESSTAGSAAFGDDVVGCSVYNAGTVRATCGFLVGGGISGEDFAQGIGIDAACVNGIGFTGIGGATTRGINLGGTYTAAGINFPGTYPAYGIDFASGTWSGGTTGMMMRFKNGTSVVALNAAGNADLNVFKFNNLNEFHIESAARFGGTTTVAALLNFADGQNIQVGSTNGTKIGTATTQKLAFFNASPIIQPSSTTDLKTSLVNLGLIAGGGATPLALGGGALSGLASVTVQDGGSIIAGATSGLKIGTSATLQKLGFFNSAPVIQPVSGGVRSALIALGLISAGVTADGASSSYAVATKTGVYTLTTADDVILADATTAAFALTLPTSVGNTGEQFIIKRINSGANDVTVGTTSSETIDGVTTFVLGPLDSVTVISDGANWRIA